MIPKIKHLDLLIPTSLLVLFASSLLVLFAAPLAVTDQEVDLIEKNMPTGISPKKKYKLLCLSKAFGYYHQSIPIGSKMAQIMGEKTGLFDVTITDDPADLSTENLAQYDGLLLNNSTHIHKGLKTDEQRQALTDFVKNGGGLIALHGATDGGWPEYTEMVGGNFDGHPWGHEGLYTIANEDPQHPVSKGFNNGQAYRLSDELYQYKDFHRNNVRVLLSVDMSEFRNYRGGRKRADEDYALAWVKEHGQGRVFVSSLGHNNHVFYDPEVLKLWVQGFRYALGDLDVDTSSKEKPTYAQRHTEGTQHPAAKFRSEEQSLKEFAIQAPYSLELVAGDDMTTEPVACAWDGNGRMYIAEWHSYMTDIKGTDTLAKKSRVIRLEDTTGDGLMDKRTVFADNLLLPRMILPLLDSVLIGETNTNDIYEYKDTNNDGIHDEKKLWYEGGKRGGNVEHQPSGLVWSIDNWIYTTYNNYRLRYTNGNVIKGETKGNKGQWGLTQDNNGKVMYVDAGAGIGPVHPLFPTLYSKWHPKWVLSEGFRNLHGIDSIADSEGGFGSLKPNGSAKSFTAACGQAIFRGDRLPSELIGNMFFGEPVGRLFRRSIIKTDEMGRRTFHNPYQEKEQEFLASTDANFRPINSATGPDGTLHLIDMHRGVVQESQWVKEGGHIHTAISFYGLDQNIGRGRIYRLRHPDFQPGPMPNMLDESPAQLVRHLAHPNGWWRDEAQKLIILHNDKSVIPDLTTTLHSSDTPLARLHALWTLEGLSAITPDLLTKAYQDPDANVRAAAIRITEPYFLKNLSQLDMIKPLIQDDHHDVAIQILLSMSLKVTPETRAIAQAVLRANPHNDYLKEIDQELNKAYFEEKARQEQLANLAAEERELLDAGITHFGALCASCHGSDGKGALAGDQQLAPSFINNPHVLGDKEILIRIALNGITGPLRGKTYGAGVMMPLKTNDDDYLAAVLTYLRKSWGNNANHITAQEVAKVREETKNITESYTEKSLQQLMLNSSSDIKLWTITASGNHKNIENLQDDDPKNTLAITSGLKPGTFIEIEFPHKRNIFQLNLQAKGGDFSEELKIESSENGTDWKTIAQNITGKTRTEVSFDLHVAQKVRLTNTKEKGTWWQISDIQILGPEKGTLSIYPPEQRHYANLKDAKSATSGFQKPQQDKSVSNKEMKIGKTTYKRGIGTHAPSEIIFDISGKGYQRFFSKVGHDKGGFDTETQFEVHIDGQLASQSKSLKKGDPAETIDLDISTAKEIKLIVTGGIDNQTSGDHANWANASFIK
jgi:type 1 glutamine amidotransferase/mono/diheme cytochrome c family protein/glucose/arabinose dehydrogenase